MAYRVRLTLEYDLDVEGELLPETVAALVEEERRAWVVGGVDVQDLVACEGESVVKLELVSD